MNIFSVTFSNVLLTLLYLIPGFLLCRIGKVRAEHTSSISTILLYVCGPCMFLNSLTDLDLSAELSVRMLLFFAVTLATEVIFLALMFLALGQKRKEFSFRIMSLASVMGNVGFFGLPIVRAAFPDTPEAAAYSCIFCASMNILAWTLGVFFLTGDRKYMSFRAAFLNPTILAVAAGLVLYFTQAKNWMPEVLRGGIRTVGAMSTPMCMFVLGIRLSTMNLKKLFTEPVPYLASAGKLIAFPLISYLLVLPFPLAPVFKASILILSATPCASIILNLAEIHHNGQETAADCALLSTLLSIATIPLLSLLLSIG
ncbi:MAG: AEC family transporter [Clostridiales bacterium]|nr:AEC family transporter [Clostridiales bacterium]